MSVRITGVARKALGLVRLTFGSIALAAPHILIHRISSPNSEDVSRADPDETAAKYAFRLFGVRTVIIGLELLLLKGAPLDRAANLAPVIHGSDTVAAILAARSGRLSARTGLMLVSVSALNTALSFLARRRKDRQKS